MVFILSSRWKVFNKLSFRLQVPNSPDKKENKKKRKTKHELRNELARSLVEGEVFENEELDQRADKIINHEATIPLVREYETVTRSKKKGVLNLTYIQGQ